jgi:hypothetical protein
MSLSKLKLKTTFCQTKSIRSIYGSKDTVYDAFYKLEYARSNHLMYLTLLEVPKPKLDDVFERKMILLSP